ncbi:MAG: D-alanyl-D-alanine carboxypeptidase [Clostridia bacterium]|nr:D-alanyl-D-alanine carboxypeptidase [Clostridia bacterium]
MKKKIISFVISCLLFLPFEMSAYAGGIGVSAQSAVLMCANNGEVLFAKNEHKQLSMASTTKIMTSLIALEAAIPETEITVTKEMVSVEGTSMGLLEGDSVSLRELVYGMLLQSGNDAANTVAYVIGGSPEGFAELMNARAAEIGMKNTSFVTASGLDDEKHYSTAYDMALLACESIGNPEFAAICSQKNARLTYGNPPYARTLTNHNRLLWKYPDAIGIKTGFTKKSGRCLVSAAERDGIVLVAVTLNAPSDWNDHISMFEYGFSKCQGVSVGCDLRGIQLKVVGGEKQSVGLRLSYDPIWLKDKKCSYRLMVKPFEYAPVVAGKIVGTAIFFSGDKIIDEVPVEAVDFVEGRIAAPPDKEPQTQEEKGLFSKITAKIKDFFQNFRGELIGR